MVDKHCNFSNATAMASVSFLLLCLQGKQFRVLGGVNSLETIVWPVLLIYSALNSGNIEGLGFFPLFTRRYY